jgi:hypothetical protein
VPSNTPSSIFFPQEELRMLKLKKKKSDISRWEVDWRVSEFVPQLFISTWNAQETNHAIVHLIWAARRQRTESVSSPLYAWWPWGRREKIIVTKGRAGKLHCQLPLGHTARARDFINSSVLHHTGWRVGKNRQALQVRLKSPGVICQFRRVG